MWGHRKWCWVSWETSASFTELSRQWEIMGNIFILEQNQAEQRTGGDTQRLRRTPTEWSSSCCVRADLNKESNADFQCWMVDVNHRACDWEPWDVCLYSCRYNILHCMFLQETTALTELDNVTCELTMKVAFTLHDLEQQIIKCLSSSSSVPGQLVRIVQFSSDCRPRAVWWVVSSVNMNTWEFRIPWWWVKLLATSPRQLCQSLNEINTCHGSLEWNEFWG